MSGPRGLTVRWSLAEAPEGVEESLASYVDSSVIGLQMADGTVKTLTQALERVKAQIRARVEHPFHVVKNLFHYKKVRYKGLAKNKAQLYSLFGLANLVIAKKRLLDLGPQGIGAS